MMYMLYNNKYYIFSYSHNLSTLTQPHNPLPTYSQALTIQILLRMNRIDLATNKLKEMKTTSEEHGLTRLAATWIAYAYGDKTKLQNAVYTYEELIDKYCKLFDGMSVCIVWYVYIYIVCVYIVCNIYI